MSVAACDALVAALRPVLAPFGIDEVHAATQLSGGASRQTYSVDVRSVNRDAPRLVVQVAAEGYEHSMEQEAAVLRVAAAAGVPVAEVVTASDDPSTLGAPYLVLAHVAGETIARRILRDEVFGPARAALAGQLGRALGKLHRVDAGSPAGGALAAGAADITGLEHVDPLTRYREVLDELGEPHPTFELAFRWLERTRPPGAGRVSLVHGDARLGNLIVDRSGLAALIDWELAHLGDPLEDLGWLCTVAWRFGGPAPVGGFGAYDDLLRAYEASSGVTVDLDALHWWEAVGSLKWGIICIVQADAHRSGRRRSHELAAIGRRVCANEHDLLAMMPPTWPAARSAGGGR